MSGATRPLAGWVISLDLWGTLISYGDREAEAAWRLREFQTVLTEFGHEIPEELLRDSVTHARAVTLQQQRMTGHQPSAHTQVTAMLTALGVNAPAIVEVLVVPHTHAVLRACPEPLPGAHQALAATKAAGGRLVLTSNTLATPPTVTRQILDGLDLVEPFDDMVFSGDVGVAKPHPAVFATVAERSATDVSRVVHVGNDWRTDVLGALRAGCRALWFNPKAKPPRHEAPGIARLDELPAALTTLCSARARVR